MYKMNKISFVLFLSIVLFSCSNKTATSDATGTFEAEEIIVSAEQTGKITTLNIKEGQELTSNTVIGQIDVSNLNSQKQQSIASAKAIKSKMNDANPQIGILQAQIGTQNAQIATLNQQLAVLNKEVSRIQNLVEADAVPRKQLDDLQGQKSILQKQIMSSEEQLGVLKAQISAAQQNVVIQNRSILSEVDPAEKRIDIIDEQIARGVIKNTFAGTVLTKYANAGEFATMGKPLYKIADLSTITLRAYISGGQLPLIKLNQKVTVLTDNGQGGFKETEGTIVWISSKSEFTPKTIQTKEERANLVYATKISVKNDGYFKIGMYGEVKF